MGRAFDFRACQMEGAIMSGAKLLAAIEAETTLDVIDTHTAGQPTRIVLDTEALPVLEGETMLEQHTSAIDRWDTVRRRLVHEPRGHSDMFGAFVLPPKCADGEAGVLFCDTKGFLTMCVHGAIGVSRVLMKIRQQHSLRMDTPAGLVEASAEPDASRTDALITVRNVPSFLSMSDQRVMLNGRDTVFDIAFGGNFAALVDVTRLGLEISADRIWELRVLGDALLKEINRTLLVQHPAQPAIRGVTLAYFYQASEGFTQIRSIVVFGDRQVDRSPCGTGSSAMLAALVARGHLAPQRMCTIHSALGSQFVGYIDEQDFCATEHRFAAFRPIISARSHITGINRLIFERSDPFKNGFVL